MPTPARTKVERLQAPLADLKLLELLWHKGKPWTDDLRCRIEGKYVGSVDRFFVARAGKELVAHIWYTVSADDPRIGLLGHVYTRPEHRRRGISTRLMEAAMADFVASGGQVMQLCTSTPETVPFYEKHGFENLYANRVLHETDWLMRFPANSRALLEPWFAPAPARIRPISAGDLPKYSLLFNLEYGTRLKDYAQGMGLGLECEYVFPGLLDRLSRGQGVCYVLDNGATIVGVASLMKFGFPHQSHLGILDLYVHPTFKTKSKEIVDTCLARRKDLGLEFVYAMAVDDAKRQTFTETGFQPKGVYKNHYKIRDQHFDATLYQWGAAETPAPKAMQRRVSIPYA